MNDEIKYDWIETNQVENDFSMFKGVVYIMDHPLDGARYEVVSLDVECMLCTFSTIQS